MSVFTTLVKREFLEHKIAMFWVPLIIAGLMAIVMAIGLAKGSSNISFDGQSLQSGKGIDGQITLDIDDIADTPQRRAEILRDIKKLGPNSGVTITEDELTIDIAQARKSGGLAQIEKIKDVSNNINSMAPVAASVTAAPVFITALISVLFMLLGSLHEERSDRSILFWKSMPVSDTQTVLAKGVTIIGGTFLFATLISIVLSIVSLVFFNITARTHNVEFLMVGMSSISNFFWVWVSMLSALVMYILWAAPIYGWLLFVSAAAPRAPFLFATLPLVAAVVMEQILRLPTRFGEEVGARLVGAYIGTGEGVRQFSRNFSEDIFANISKAPAAIFSSLTHVNLWIGLAVAAGLVYGAIQMRKRKAL
jgi:ABC-2 type transport system permease protein